MEIKIGNYSEKSEKFSYLCTPQMPYSYQFHKHLIIN